MFPMVHSKRFKKKVKKPKKLHTKHSQQLTKDVGETQTL